ncbi:hypothetical protein BDQ17DRAFT_1428464 [Cyathus striatus]|nr:hypothetical protein BDQ17DRAFT_1428464 [Cyathus striatus]
MVPVRKRMPGALDEESVDESIPLIRRVVHVADYGFTAMPALVCVCTTASPLQRVEIPSLYSTFFKSSTPSSSNSLASKNMALEKVVTALTGALF